VVSTSRMGWTADLTVAASPCRKDCAFAAHQAELCLLFALPRSALQLRSREHALHGTAAACRKISTREPAWRTPTGIFPALQHARNNASVWAKTDCLRSCNEHTAPLDVGDAFCRYAATPPATRLYAGHGTRAWCVRAAHPHLTHTLQRTAPHRCRALRASALYRMFR